MPAADTIAAAALVAMLEEKPLARDELRELSGLSPFRFGRALATARYHGLVEIPDGVVTLTERARGFLARPSTVGSERG